MKLTYHLVDSLPKLAWCAVVERELGMFTFIMVRE